MRSFLFIYWLVEIKMTQWLHAEYREFDGYPRMMVCAGNDGTYLFLSRFDNVAGNYLDYYEVYRINPLEECRTCMSWFGLETQAIKRLPDLPVTDFPFNTERQEFLPYDSIVQLLRGNEEPSSGDTS